MTPPPVGALCRCLKCCCPPGQGHNDPRWVAYEGMLDAIETEREASEPTRCAPAAGVHATPHVGCILR